MLPIVVRNISKALDNLGRVYFDSELPPAVKTSWRKVNRPYDGSRVIGQEHLTVKLQMLKLMNFNSNIIHNAQSANAFRQLLLLQFVRWPCYHMDLHAPLAGAYQALDNYTVLIPLILCEQCMFGLVDEAGDSISPVRVAPNQGRLLVDLKWLAFPVCFEAFNNFRDLLLLARYHRIVTRHRQVLRVPVERFDVGHFIVYHPRLLVSNVELWVRVNHVDVRRLQRLVGLLVF